jgi:formate hydrogenlyase transcriptional activator
MKKLLYVDDEPNNLILLKINLEKWFEVVTTDKPRNALEIIEKENIQVLITDQRMPVITGIELAEKVKAHFPLTVIIILTAYDDSNIMLKAINHGGIFRYLLKPWDLNDLKQTLYSAFEAYSLRKKNIDLINDLLEKNRTIEKAFQEITLLKNKLEEENIQLKEEYRQNALIGEIVGKSKALRLVLRQLEQIAKSDSSVLLLGETGTGKELFAKAIHKLSGRKEKMMVSINCAAIPESLIESELFGHEKGAFTGASQLKYGKFEVANNGSLFLDEVGELPLNLQPKLLRVLQEKEFERLGNNRIQKADVRLIAATNRNLEIEVENGRFRSDLYYRLNVLPIVIPPLRERKEDIPLLVNFFIEKLNRKTGKKVELISKATLDKLMEYNWPGNVRELENVVERSHVLSEGSKLEIGSWFKPNSGSGNSDLVSLDNNEKLYILKVLKLTNWKIRGNRGAAGILQIHPSTLESRMKKLGIERPV